MTRDQVKRAAEVSATLDKAQRMIERLRSETWRTVTVKIGDFECATSQGVALAAMVLLADDMKEVLKSLGVELDAAA